MFAAPPEVENRDVDRAVSHALRAFGPVRAQLCAHEDLDADRAVRGRFDIVLEDDQTVIVLVVLVRICCGAQRIVLRQCRYRRSRDGRCQKQFGDPFEHGCLPCCQISLWVGPG